MKTQTTLVLFCMFFTILFFGCKEENKESFKQQTVIQSAQEIATQPISEERIIEEKKTIQDTDQTKTEDPLNVLDMQAKIYTDVFANLGGVEELQGIENFMDLIEKADATPETKKQLTEHYELYSNSLDPEKKEELKAQMSAMLLKAMDQ